MLIEWYTASALAALALPGLPGTERRTRERAIREDWLSRPRAGRGGGQEYHISALPEAARRALELRAIKAVAVATLEAPEQGELAQKFAAAPEKFRLEAQRRLAAILSLTAYRASGLKKGPARALVAQDIGVSVSTIRGWEARIKPVRQRSLWACALLPQYLPGQVQITIPEAAFRQFASDYLRLEQPPAASCYRRLLKAAVPHNWGKLPTCATFSRRIEREFARMEIVYLREGREAAERLIPAQERDRAGLYAMEALNADGHKFDVWVRWHDGSVVRVIGLFWQDLYSGKILSYRIDISENIESVRLSFADLVKNHGIPKKVYLDNGRAFASKTMTGGIKTRFRGRYYEGEALGILPMLGIDVHWCTPGHGQAKPIERAFRDLCSDVSKHPAFAGCYTGNNPLDKPAYSTQKAVPIDKFLAVLKEGIEEHNERIGRRSKVCAGQSSFDQVFAASYAENAQRIEQILPEQRAILFLARKTTQAAKRDGSIRICGNRYWSEQMVDLAGQQLIAHYDADDLHGEVFVYDSGGRFVCRAQCEEAVGFTNIAAAQDVSRRKNRILKAKKKIANNKVAIAKIEADSLGAEAPEVLLEKDEHTTWSTRAPKAPDEAAILAAEAARTATFADLQRGLDLLTEQQEEY